MREGWKILPFENSIQKVKYTTKVPSSEYLLQGEYPIVSQEEGLISGYWNNLADVFHHSKPIVIFGDHTRIIKYVDFDFVLGADGVKILLPVDGLSAKFLSYYLQWYKVPSLGYSRHFKLLKEASIPVPPVQEQEKIVAELDCLTGIIEKKKVQLKELDRLAQSVFYDMFGDPIANEKGWVKNTINDLCVITCGQDHKSIADGKGPYPIYGSGGIMGRASQYRCPKDSVIIGRKGNINNPIYVKEPFWNVDTAFGITPNSNLLNPMFFYFFCLEYDFTQHDVSVTIPSLRRTDILQIKVPTPPIALQNEFAQKIETIDKQKELVKQSIAETETLFNSRMDYWFN